MCKAYAVACLEQGLRQCKCIVCIDLAAVHNKVSFGWFQRPDMRKQEHVAEFCCLVQCALFLNLRPTL